MNYQSQGLPQKVHNFLKPRENLLWVLQTNSNKHYVYAPNGRCGRDGIGSTFSASFFDNLRWIVCVRQAGAEINLQMCVVREHNSMAFVKNNGPGTTLVGQFCSGFPTVWSLRMGSSGSRDHTHVKNDEILLCRFFFCSVVIPHVLIWRCITGVSSPPFWI